MDSQRWALINEIFDEAHELPAGDRAAFVRQACSGDEDLEKEVLSLLHEGDSMHSLVTDDGHVKLLDFGIEALAIRLKAYGEDHEDVAETRALLASI